MPTPGAEAAPVVHYAPSELSLNGVTMPVRFWPGLSGSTTLGVNRTSAETSVAGASVLLSLTSLLDIDSWTLMSQSTSIRLVSADGLPRISYAEVTLGGTSQVYIRDGVVRYAEGSAIPLAGLTTLTAGGTLQIDKGQKARMNLEVRSVDVHGTVLVEKWVVNLDG